MTLTGEKPGDRGRAGADTAGRLQGCGKGRSRDLRRQLAVWGVGHVSLGQGGDIRGAHNEAPTQVFYLRGSPESQPPLPLLLEKEGLVGTSGCSDDVVFLM